MRAVKLSVVLLCLIAAGIVFRYGSVDPCAWLVHDWSAKSGMPEIVARGLVFAKLRTPEPSAQRCVTELVDLHINGIDAGR